MAATTTAKPIKEKHVFTSYQKLVIVILALTQFTVVMDFMIMNPITHMLISTFKITDSQMGIAIAAYAFSAAIAGISAAGFADKYDRKKLLVILYAGFFAGTVWCGMARSYEMLVAGRVVAGLFGGVLSSVSMAIITDLFPIHVRGRAMGFIQLGFAASQALGIPLSIYFANLYGWNFPFYIIAGLIVVVWVLINIKIKPITEHLALQTTRNPFMHMGNAITNRKYRIAFIASCMLPIGGYLLMPFGNPYLINNMGISEYDIPMIFLITGICSLFIMPAVGKISDALGKLRTLIAGSILASTMVLIYANLPIVPLWVIIVINAVMFAGIMSRMIPSSALISAIPDMADRGAFMSVNSALTQMAGGLAAVVGGLIVHQKSEHAPVEHYDILAYVSVAVMFACIYFMVKVNRQVAAKIHEKPATV